MANNNEIIEKIKFSFETLSNLLVTHEEWLSSIFLAIASHNANMGDWIINNFLNLNGS